MSRYIDAEKAIEALAKYEMWSAEVDYPYCSHDLEDWKELPRKHLENVPSIEIVLCKDCKHFMPYSDIERAVTPYKDTDGICHGGYPRANDFFCAGGERKMDTH